MNKSIFKILTLIFLFISSYTYAQEIKRKLDYKHQVGFGGMYYGSDNNFLTISYVKNLKNKNELIFPLYFYIFGPSKSISASVGFNLATNKNSRFIFYLGRELHLFFDWRPKGKSDLYVNRYGYFACLGLSPSYRISSRLKIAFDLKVGHGYLWGKNNEISVNNQVHEGNIGWMYVNYTSLRLNYYF